MFIFSKMLDGVIRGMGFARCATTSQGGYTHTITYFHKTYNGLQVTFSTRHMTSPGLRVGIPNDEIRSWDDNQGSI